MPKMPRDYKPGVGSKRLNVDINEEEQRLLTIVRNHLIDEEGGRNVPESVAVRKAIRFYANYLEKGKSKE
jgi:hypothetical protein